MKKTLRFGPRERMDSLCRSGNSSIFFLEKLPSATRVVSDVAATRALVRFLEDPAAPEVKDVLRIVQLIAAKDSWSNEKLPSAPPALGRESLGARRVGHRAACWHGPLRFRGRRRAYRQER